MLEVVAIKVKKMKKIFESMAMVFNDELVKALYITIFIII